MPNPDQRRVPRQARSRETEHRLYTATVRLLTDDGLDALTLTRVADTAGTSQGGVYRRFSDKTALTEWALLRWLEDSEDRRRLSGATGQLAKLALSEAIPAIAASLVAQYRTDGKILRALDRVLTESADEVFRSRAIDLISRGIMSVAGALASIGDPAPDDARVRTCTFAVMSAATLIEAHVLGTSPVWGRVMPLDDTELSSRSADLMRACLDWKPDSLPSSGD